MSISKTNIRRFVTESNAIEGIHREPTAEELEATSIFVHLAGPLTVPHLQTLVATYQPDAQLRAHPAIPGVRVGNHIAPPSGEPVLLALKQLLLDAHNPAGVSPYHIHQRYEYLHPFTDGNGRSGRALRLWQMRRIGYRGELAFLHSYYYQSLHHYHKEANTP